MSNQMHHGEFTLSLYRKHDALKAQGLQELSSSLHTCNLLLDRDERVGGGVRKQPVMSKQKIFRYFFFLGHYRSLSMRLVLKGNSLILYVKSEG